MNKKKYEKIIKKIIKKKKKNRKMNNNNKDRLALGGDLDECHARDRVQVTLSHCHAGQGQLGCSRVHLPQTHCVILSGCRVEGVWWNEVWIDLVYVI